MSTAAALLVVLILRVLMRALPAPGQPHPLARTADVLLLTALITGILCLIFTALAHRVRKTAPPRSIAIAAVLIGLSPLAMIAAMALVAL